MRGEHSQSGSTPLETCGSSPHAWGTRAYRRHQQRQRRFIPTCVGNTGKAGTRTAPMSVHPHMRGEHLTQSVHYLMPSGSSPHAWGTQDSRVVAFGFYRFIPTCVGNTSAVSKN